ncbi:hypothetical protein C0J52_23489 [Blattella germanica]|nr:hypothetical protein C0J52_23489 [Blattella germanica]
MYGEEHTDPNEDGKNDIYISRVSSEGELQLIQLMDKQKDENELSNTKLAFDELEERSNEELNCLRGELECFKEKLHNYEHENEYLIEEDKKNKQLILDAANREVKLQKECTIREKQLVDKLKSIQNENFNFTHTIDKLAEQLADFRCELAEKNTEVQGLVKQNQSLHETIEHLQNENCVLQREVHELKHSMKSCCEEHLLQNQLLERKVNFMLKFIQRVNNMTSV